MNVYYVIIAWLHLLATVIWIGGMAFYVLVLIPSLAAIDPPQRGRLLGVLIKRYAPIAWGSVILLIVTGVLITVNRAALDALSRTAPYRIVLAIKHVIVLAMVAIGAITSFVIGPKLMAPPPKPEEASSGPPPAGPPPEVMKLQRRSATLGNINLALGVIVLLLTAILRRL
ncbi:MAG: CopD family protein [bacterium]